MGQAQRRLSAAEDAVMDRRRFMWGVAAVLAWPIVPLRAVGAREEERIAPLRRSEEEWRRILTPEQFQVLRRGGTEPPGSSPLLHEKRAGEYVCAGCGLALFTSDMKYDSGTGWPSFYTTIPGRVGTKLDFKIILPRTEYHCVRCGGHQGHVFDDGPPPTGKRWCNNGVALRFVPKDAAAS